MRAQGVARSAREESRPIREPIGPVPVPVPVPRAGVCASGFRDRATRPPSDEDEDKCLPSVTGTSPARLAVQQTLSGGQHA